MSAFSVCSGTRPSRFHSTRAISEPPSRPLTRIFTPCAPARIVFISDCLMARRNAIRFSSWAATFSATSWALSSGFLISWMVTRTRFPVIRSSSSRSWSTLVPPLPMTMPGLAVCSVMVSADDERSVSIRATPAFFRRASNIFRRRLSSSNRGLYSLSGANHFASQLR